MSRYWSWTWKIRFYAEMLQATQLHLQDWTSSRGGSVDQIDLNYVNFSFNFSFLRPMTHLTRSNHCVPGFHLLIQKNCVKSGYTSSITSLQWNISLIYCFKLLLVLFWILLILFWVLLVLFVLFVLLISIVSSHCYVLFVLFKILF